MKRQKFLTLWGISLLIGSCSHLTSLTASNSRETKSELPSLELWSTLHKARENKEHYVILFRHALAPGTGDPDNFQLDDCSTQRNLNEEGRQQAIRMGEELKRRKIPVTRILSSQWCRCLETAKLMDVGEVEPFAPLNSFFRDRNRSSEQTNQLRQFLLENDHDSGVMIMVSHQVNITAISDIFPKSGEGVVLSIEKEDGEIEVIGQ
ncbi:histidine phosphatase family protein, partial [Crocosphaera chwakensis]